jgi:hypothetical protein
MLDPYQGNEEQTDVMVDALRDGLVQAAPGASPGGIVQGSGFGLHTGNNEKHRAVPVHLRGLMHVFEMPWLADDFSNAHVKQIRLVGGLEHQCRIRTPGRTANGEDIGA